VSPFLHRANALYSANATWTRGSSVDERGRTRVWNSLPLCTRASGEAATDFIFCYLLLTSLSSISSAKYKNVTGNVRKSGNELFPLLRSVKNLPLSLTPTVTFVITKTKSHSRRSPTTNGYTINTQHLKLLLHSKETNSHTFTK